MATPWSEASLDVVSAFSLHADGSSNRMVVISYGFLRPVTVELIDLDDAPSPPLPRPLKALPARFDASGMSAGQHFAMSLDGTRVPYFVVGRDLSPGQERPLLLYGYGAHGVVSDDPGLQQLDDWQPVFALANIRGGGEYGYKWHEAAAPNRLRAYEDFEAVASHLISELQLTIPGKLACMGGSLGGLLTANMLPHSRDNGLFAAVVSECPIADMERFRFLGMGLSWISELGDPSTAEGWERVQQYSPLHRIAPAGERRFAYPRALFVSSNDRTHPAHGRKIVAKMHEVVGEAAGALLYEEGEGGHGGNADLKQMARQTALIFYFLWRTLAPEADVPTTCPSRPDDPGDARRRRRAPAPSVPARLCWTRRARHWVT